MTDAELLEEFRLATAKLKSTAGGKAEGKYGEAYQALVKAGLAPQLRERMRA